MKGLSRKNLSQVAAGVDDWFSAAGHSSLPERLNYGRHASSRSAQLTEIPQLSLPGGQSTQHSRSCSTLTFTPLIDRPFVLLFEPDSNSRGGGQFLRLPTIVLFATSAPRGRWAYDYFWLCVGAYSSDWSSAAARTSALLILTHDPCIGTKALTVQQAARVQQSALTS
jgi:hypothetical protein